MRIDWIKFKNINSYGDTTQHIAFDTAGELVLLHGQNGTGKSTINEAIMFAIYGKIDGKRKYDIVNRINKNMQVEVQLQSKNRRVKILRGLEPNVFRVWINGEEYDQAGDLNVQDYLETEIFEIPYQVFKNVIILSIDDFTSFLTMSPGEKRNIIDRLFGFEVLNMMREEIRASVKDVKRSIEHMEEEITIREDSISSLRKTIVEMQTRNDAALVDSLKAAAENQAESKKSLQKMKDGLDKIITNQQTIEIDRTIQRRSLSEHTTLIRSGKSQLGLVNNSTCPVCTQDISAEYGKVIKTDINRRIDAAKTEADKVALLVADLDDNLNKSKSVAQGVRGKIATISADIGRYDTRIRDIEKELATTDNHKELEDLITENASIIDDKNKNIDTDNGEISIKQIADSMLGEDGVKNVIISNILPPLNANIANMVSQMHLPYILRFNERFDCVLMDMGDEISAKTLSTGEAKKYDFVVIIAFLKLLKMRYPNLNVHFLDEIFSSVDYSSRHEILKILADMSVEFNMSTWVINHSELPVEVFDRTANTFVDGSFSRVEISTVE